MALSRENIEAITNSFLHESWEKAISTYNWRSYYTNVNITWDEEIDNNGPIETLEEEYCNIVRSINILFGGAK